MPDAEFLSDFYESEDNQVFWQKMARWTPIKSQKKIVGQMKISNLFENFHFKFEMTFLSDNWKDEAVFERKVQNFRLVVEGFYNNPCFQVYKDPISIWTSRNITSSCSCLLCNIKKNPGESLKVCCFLGFLETVRKNTSKIPFRWLDRIFWNGRNLKKQIVCILKM